MIELIEITECCICLEDKRISYSCECCKEGKICYECMVSKRRIEDDDKEYIKCPICRTYNWKLLYADFLSDLGAFFEGMSGLKWKPAHDICYKNCPYN